MKHQGPTKNQQREMAQAVENPDNIDVELGADAIKNSATKKASPNKPLQGPNMIGSYRITKTLGQGTFGKVKEGVHVFTDQKVAIKILEKNKITDVNDVERVTREIHILKIVSHPNIIQLYEIIETPCRLFLIMEHCCNGELFSYITSKNKLKEEESCRLFQQLIAALEYLGRLGIVHRDVKPENLLLDEQLNLKVVDFGLSNTFNAGEKLATACGSPCYAAPELIKGLEYLGPKADLWSAGVVLYTLVCGHLPFEDNNTQSLYQKILSADYKFTCYLSREVRNLIENILVPDPELRYGLKQITSNSWFKNSHPLSIQISSLGRNVGTDPFKIYYNVINEIEQQKEANIEGQYVKQCIHANRFNAATAHYYLLVKKKQIRGEPLLAEKLRNPLNGKESRDNNQIDHTQRALIAAGRQTKKYQSIEPQRTTLYNEKNKYQLRKIAEGLHEFQNIKKITVAPDNSVADSNQTSVIKGVEQPYINQEQDLSPIGGSLPVSRKPSNKKMNGQQNAGSGGTNLAQKFLFSPTLTEEANEEKQQKDDDYQCSQSKGQGQLIFSPTGQRTSGHFRQFPISPTNNAPEKENKSQSASKQVDMNKTQNIGMSRHTTESIQSNKRPFDSSLTVDYENTQGGVASDLITSDDQGNQIYQIFEALGESSSKILPTLLEMNNKTVGDMLNRPNTGFELFGRGSSIGHSQFKVSENRNQSSFQLENNKTTEGSIMTRPTLGGSGGVQPGQPYKRKMAYNVTTNTSNSQSKAKKKTNRGEQYQRKASSNLDFLKNGSSNGQVVQQNSNANAPYPRSGGQHKMFDQQIRQLLNQSQIVESDNQMLLIESGTTNVGATELRKMTSQLSKQMPNVTRISAMSNYNTNIRPSKQSKQKVRHSGNNNGIQGATLQHGLLQGHSTGMKIQGTNQRKTNLGSTRDNLDRIIVQGQAQKPLATTKIQTQKNPQNATISMANNPRKGSMNIISPTNQKPDNDAGCSGTTQNTRLISSGSHLQNKNQQNGPQNSNSANKGSKGSKQALIKNSKQNLNQTQLNNINVLTNLVSPNNQVAAQFLNQHPTGAATTQAKATMNQTGIQFLPTSPIALMTPGPNGMSRLQTIDNDKNQNRIADQQMQNLSVGLNQRPTKKVDMNMTQPISGANALAMHNRTASASAMHNSNQIPPLNSKRKTSQKQTLQTQTNQVQKNLQQGVPNLQPYLQQNINPGKQRNAAVRANSTLAYASNTSSGQHRTGQQLSDFIVPTQFNQQAPSSIKQNTGKGNSLGMANVNNPLNTISIGPQNTRNMHARAMTSLGTSGPQQPEKLQKFVTNRNPVPNILSPTSVLPSDLIELKTKQMNGNKQPLQPQKVSTGGQVKRGTNNMMNTQTPQALQTLLHGVGQTAQNEKNFQPNMTGMVITPTPPPPGMQAQIKPQLKQQQQVSKFTNNAVVPKSGGQRRPPSARHRSKLQPTGQSVQGSQIVSPNGQMQIQKR